MSGAKFSNRDLTSCSIRASSTFALRNWIVLASKLPSLYLVAAVDVCDMLSFDTTLVIYEPGIQQKGPIVDKFTMVQAWN
jgi:hypothetical protein